MPSQEEDEAPVPDHRNRDYYISKEPDAARNEIQKVALAASLLWIVGENSPSIKQSDELT